MKKTDQYLYGGKPAEIRSAAGQKGMIIRALDGNMMFRVCYGNGRFTDYEIRHDDLSVTINEGALASFYKVGDREILGHSPEVLGLSKATGLIYSPSDPESK